MTTRVIIKIETGEQEDNEGKIWKDCCGKCPSLKMLDMLGLKFHCFTFNKEIPNYMHERCDECKASELLLDLKDIKIMKEIISKSDDIAKQAMINILNHTNKILEEESC